MTIVCVSGDVSVDATGDRLGLHCSVDRRRCDVSNHDVFPNLRALLVQLHTRVHIIGQVCGVRRKPI